MKKLLLFFSLLLSLLPLSLPAAAETYTVSYDNLSSISPTTAPKTNHVLLKTGAVGWDITSNSTYLAKDGNAPKGVKLGKKAEPATIATFASSDNENSPFKGKLIKSAIINAAGSTSSTSPTLEFYVDDTQVGLTQNLKSGSHTEVNFNDINLICKKSIKIVLKQTNTNTNKVNALTLGDFSITYEDAPSGPVDFDYDLPASHELEEGQTFDLGLPEERPSNITWTSDHPDVAVVENGIINAKKEGTANIKMTWEADANFNASSEEGQTIVVTVKKHQLVEYNPGFPESVNLVLGNNDKDYYDFVLGEKHPAIKWTVSDTNIAEMIDNSVLAVAKGNTVVKATWDADDYFLAGEASTTVNVVEEIIAAFTPETITTSIDPAKGETATAKYEAVGSEEIAIDNFNFSSSDESIATYDPATGIVTLKAVGSATITATLTEEAAKEYIFADAINPTLSVSVADINGPIGYELVTSLDQITDEDYYTIAANYNSKTYAMSGKTGTSGQIDAIEATLKDGLIEYGDSTILKLKLTIAEKTETATKYSITTANLKENGTLTASSANLNINSTSTSTATISINNNIATIVFASTRQILFRDLNGGIFKNYSNQNASSSGYAPVSLYRLNFVKAEAPDYEDFEGKGVGDQVKFTARHSSHKLQYREWVLSKTLSRAEVEKQYLSDWKDATDVTSHTHIIKNLDDVQDNIAAHGVEVRSVDSRGNVSSTVGFSYDGQKTVTGIESVAAEAEAEGALYNLQGVRVNRATAAPGLYIERRGGKAVKVIL